MIDVAITDHLAPEPRAEIQADRFRWYARAGIGKRLVERAEQWAQQQGSGKCLRSGYVAAHCFYLREGYERIKTSAVFSKTLIANG